MPKIDSRAQLICTCLVGSRRLWDWQTTWKDQIMRQGRNSELLKYSVFSSPWGGFAGHRSSGVSGTLTGTTRFCRNKMLQPDVNHHCNSPASSTSSLETWPGKLVCVIKPGIFSLCQCSNREQLGCLIPQFRQILCIAPISPLQLKQGLALRLIIAFNVNSFVVLFAEERHSIFLIFYTVTPTFLPSPLVKHGCQEKFAHLWSVAQFCVRSIPLLQHSCAKQFVLSADELSRIKLSEGFNHCWSHFGYGFRWGGQRRPSAMQTSAVNKIILVLIT